MTNHGDDSRRRRRVLVTGAAGQVIRQVLPAFRDRYDLVLLDLEASVTGQGDIIHAADLRNPDLDSYRHHFRGVDTVVHASQRWLGRHYDEERDRELDNYYVERDNLDMAFHMFKASLVEGVRRVVVTSSNHAADWYETLVHRGLMDTISERDLPLSDRLYGWAKASYELLGFVFATGRFGRPLENVHIRIGAPRPIEGAKLAGDLPRYRRDLGAYVSERDLQQLYVRAIETEDIRNEHGIPFQIVYGVSGNRRRFWSLVSARRVLGYEPEDDSEVRFSEEIQRYLGP